MDLRSQRLERLANDYRALQKLCVFSDPVKIQILEKRGNPPEFYRLQISNCKGVESVNGNTPRYRTGHILVISNFPSDYPDPGKLPDVKAETDLFHPNVYSGGNSDGIFCFQGSDLSLLIQPLDFLVNRVISMIQYENLRFGEPPANCSARNWANRNQHLFPLRCNLDGGSQSRPKLNWR
jgi:ubiquitin-protein ligase